MNNDIYIPLLSALGTLMADKGPVKIAIDGRCASGKTTLANSLATIYEASIIHMDDFFLPAELRTGKRYLEPAGNIHYERFSDEVVPGLKSGKAFSYNIFDCNTMDYNGTAHINPAPLIIVEGTYSLRPEFRKLYDLKIFLDIEPNEQKQRIKARNSENMYSAFIEQWIPLEETYFTKLDVRKCCNFIISS